VSLTAAVLLLAAAGFHAGWNLAGKRRRPTPSSFLLANTAGMILLAAPVLYLYGPLLRRMPGEVWLALAATGAFQALYYGALASAYAKGDLSVAYPLARSLPVLVIPLVSVFLGRGDEIGWGCIVGTVLLAAGCFLLPMRRFGDFRVGNYLNSCCMLAAGAAIGTAGYTLIDDTALRWLRATPDRGFGVVSAALVYALAEAATSSAWLGLYVVCRRSDRAQFAQALRTQRLQATAMGASIYLAYGLVLISFAYVRNVSYAAAFRQVSILLGVGIAAVHLKECVPPPRWAGAVMLLAGLVLVATG
jgi:drug/metabolite transporter (DMT)-like permease